MVELKAWVRQQRGIVEPKSVLGRALRYIDKQWQRLTRFMHDPIMETNNDVERGLRNWARSQDMDVLWP